MTSIYRQLIAPLLSLFIFVLGNGLLTTLVALKLNDAGVGNFAIGAMTTAYYLGLILGSVRIESFIIRVGHIRAFSAFASTIAVVCILHGIFFNTGFWIVLRFICGFATAGIFIVIESWFLVLGTIKTRGQIVAVYMIAYYLAQSISQLGLNLAYTEQLMLFALSAMTASLAVIPLAMTKVKAPNFEEPSLLSPKKIYEASPTGIIGTLCAGLILGVIYGLMPIYFSHVDPDVSKVSIFMAIVIFGGMLLQYPIGKISDHIGRRTTLIVVCFFTALVSAAMLLMDMNLYLVGIMAFLLGGFSFTIYPISTSHLCDVLDSKDIIAGTQGLVLTYSTGACLGPLIAPVFMNHFGDTGMFIFNIIICTFLIGFFSWRKTQQASVPKEQQEDFITVPMTTPVASELDPRGE